MTKVVKEEKTYTTEMSAKTRIHSPTHIIQTTTPPTPASLTTTTTTTAPKSTTTTNPPHLPIQPRSTTSTSAPQPSLYTSNVHDLHPNLHLHPHHDLAPLPARRHLQHLRLRAVRLLAAPRYPERHVHAVQDRQGVDTGSADGDGSVGGEMGG